MLSHDNLIWQGTVMTNDLYEGGDEDLKLLYNFEDNKCLSFLPLSHVAAMMSDLVYTVLQGSQVFFAKPDALQGTLVESLQWAKPTGFFAVPRLWEKFEDKMKEAGKANTSTIGKALVTWAK